MADAHAHINDVKGISPSTMASKFLSAGGWFIALVSVSPVDYGVSLQGLSDSFIKAVEHHAALCSDMRSRGLKVSCLAGFHPDDVEQLFKLGLSALKVLEVGRKVVEAEAELCSRGLLDGIGEVGRQHYRTTPERLLVSQMIMEHAVSLAQEKDCVVHLHLEDVGPDTVEITHEILTSRGIRPSPKVTFHHSRPNMVRPAVELGYSATVFGRPEVLSEALEVAGPLFMNESDFPGFEGAKIVAPWNLRDNILKALAEKGLGDEAAYRINVDNVARAFGVSPP